MLKKTEFNYNLNVKNTNYLHFFLRQLLINGSRNDAEKILFRLSKLFKNKFRNKSIILLIFLAIENVKPYLEVKNVRISGMTRQVPSIINENRQITLAIRWIINAARKRKKHTSLDYTNALFLELIDAYQKQGSIKKKTEELHKLATLNRAFAHFRWW